MIIVNELLSLNDLFNRAIFRIPDYQRGYSWQEIQLEEFWSDILNLLPDRDHYTGMISLKKLDKEYLKTEKWNDERWLIDNWNYNAYKSIEIISALREFDTKSKGIGSRQSEWDLLHDLMFRIISCSGKIEI